MSNKNTSIADNVLGQIKKGEVRMKPGVYFAFLSLISLIASLSAEIAMVYLSSIVFFWFKITNASGNAYGAKNNLSQAISSFPWWAVLIFIAAVVFIVYMVRRFGANYRHKTRNIVLIIMMIAMISGFVLSNFGIGDFNHSIYDQQNGQPRVPWWKE